MNKFLTPLFIEELVIKTTPFLNCPIYALSSGYFMKMLVVIPICTERHFMAQYVMHLSQRKISKTYNAVVASQNSPYCRILAYLYLLFIKYGGVRLIVEKLLPPPPLGITLI